MSLRRNTASGLRSLFRKEHVDQDFWSYFLFRCLPKHEIGIRVALGASRGAILGLVSCETLILISAGLFLGGIGALAASRVLGHLLFGVSASDPLTLASVTIVLGAVAVLAAYVPARRAMSVDPMIALRDE